MISSELRASIFLFPVHCQSLLKGQTLLGAIISCRVHPHENNSGEPFDLGHTSSSFLPDLLKKGLLTGIQNLLVSQALADFIPPLRIHLCEVGYCFIIDFCEVVPPMEQDRIRSSLIVTEIKDLSSAIHLFSVGRD